MKNEILKSGLGILIVIGFFVLASYLVQNNLEDIRIALDFGFLSMLVYIFILITATVIAPLNAVPLVPIASNLWGWFLAGLLSILGWGLGALIAFSLARKYGVPLVKRFVSIEKMSKYERLIPQENIFWAIVFLRMAIPVDVLSYILGLFTHIKFRTYAVATFIGIAPFAFIFAFLGNLPLLYQILGIILAGLMILLGYLLGRYVKRKKADIINK